jgi:hypothetical protein
VSSKLISLLLTQLAENRHVQPILAELFDPAGAEILLRRAVEYVTAETPVTFSTVVESARRRGETAIGYRLQHRSDQPPAYGVVINPPKTDLVSFDAADGIIVVGDDAPPAPVRRRPTPLPRRSGHRPPAGGRRLRDGSAGVEAGDQRHTDRGQYHLNEQFGPVKARRVGPAEAPRNHRAQQRPIPMRIVSQIGAVDGIVTLEDLIEELVGEIYDETDRDIAQAVHEPDDAILLPGTFPVHDLPDVGVELEQRGDADFTTVAGLVLAHLGHLPSAPGETVSLVGWTAEVAAVERRAITSVRLRPIREPVSARGPDDGGRPNKPAEPVPERGDDHGRR